MSGVDFIEDIVESNKIRYQDRKDYFWFSKINSLELDFKTNYFDLIIDKSHFDSLIVK